MGTLKIDLLGVSFTIKANEDEKYLKKLLGYYRRIATEIEKNGNLKGSTQIAILSGIMICDELYKEKSANAKSFKIKQDETDAEIERLTAGMIEKIDKVLS